jgi:hypothetical protein
VPPFSGRNSLVGSRMFSGKILEKCGLEKREGGCCGGKEDTNLNLHIRLDYILLQPS